MAKQHLLFTKCGSYEFYNVSYKTRNFKAVATQQLRTLKIEQQREQKCVSEGEPERSEAERKRGGRSWGEKPSETKNKLLVQFLVYLWLG